MVPEERPAVAAVLRRLGGAAHREQILRRTTWYAPRAAVLAGEVRRVGHGTYALPGTSPAGETADGRADNPFESGLRGCLLERGDPRFRAAVPDRHGRGTFHVDLADPRRRVVTEADSFPRGLARAALHLVAGDLRA